MRNCGTCTMCCKIMAISSMKKPMYQWCQFCDMGVGCRIYDERPQECRDFECLWLQRDVVPDEFKPNKSRVVLLASHEGGLTVIVDPGMPDAWKEPRLLAWLRQKSEHLMVAVDTRKRVFQIIPWEPGYRELDHTRIRREPGKSWYKLQRFAI